MTNPYTPEKVAEEIATAQKAVWSEIHGQDATRRYSVAEVKQLVYSLDNALSSALTALTAVSAERDELRSRVAFAAAIVSGDATFERYTELERATADRDRLHKAITEALGELGDPESKGPWLSGNIPNAVRRILRAALDKKWNDDERRGVTAQDFPEARAVSSANFRRTVQGERHTFDTDACVTRECGCEQGEPTDAQVLAGLNAWFAKGREQNGIVLQLLDADDLADYSPQSQDRLRAALRAAAATQEGENR